MDDNLIPFSLKVLDFNKENSSFIVEFIPEQSSYSTLTQTLYVDLANNQEINEEEILSILSRNSPQEYWKKQRTTKNLDTSIAENIINKELSSEKTSYYLTKNIVIEPAQQTSDSTTKVTSDVEKFIESILNDQQ
jgi:hypothetical protein